MTEDRLAICVMEDVQTNQPGIEVSIDRDALTRARG
jgi:hypothetical protein